MTVDVLYEGLALLRGVTLREDKGGLFLEWDAPMPVGTRLVLLGPDGEKTARIRHVTEGTGGGVILEFVDAAAPREAEPDVTEKSEPPQHEEDGGAPKGKRDRRSKSRKAEQPH
jgi:hypothetical protein